MQVVRSRSFMSSDCAALHRVLSNGLAVVDKSTGCARQATEQQCKRAMVASRACATCGCVRIASRCQPDCALPRSLAELLEPHMNARSTCDTSAQCNVAQRAGACVQGRCRCHYSDATGQRWGGWNCSVRNEGKGLDKRYSEKVYAHYYSNLSFLSGQTLTSRVENFTSRRTSLSGPGSTAEATVGVRAALPFLLSLLGLKTIVDVPCGDFNFLREVLASPASPLGLSYTGGDIVRSLVHELQHTFGGRQHARGLHLRFVPFDLATQVLWPADLVLVRDVLFHFDAERVLTVLRHVNQSGGRFFMSTSFPAHASSVVARKFKPGRGFKSYASWDLSAKPFSLGPPILAIGDDGQAPGRIMALWRLPLWSNE